MHNSKYQLWHIDRFSNEKAFATSILWCSVIVKQCLSGRGRYDEAVELLQQVYESDSANKAALSHLDSDDRSIYCIHNTVHSENLYNDSAELGKSLKIISTRLTQNSNANF